MLFPRTYDSAIQCSPPSLAPSLPCIPAPAPSGASHLLEYMAFKTTKHRTHLRLVRESEVMGANVLASASREQMAYNIDTSKVTIPEALELLADAVINPKFQGWEVAEQVKKMEQDIKGLKDNPQTTLLEASNRVGGEHAYRNREAAVWQQLRPAGGFTLL
jgi:predicted Zn-dependent peptidase